MYKYLNRLENNNQTSMGLNNNYLLYYLNELLDANSNNNLIWKAYYYIKGVHFNTTFKLFNHEALS